MKRKFVLFISVITFLSCGSYKDKVSEQETLDYNKVKIKIYDINNPLYIQSGCGVLAFVSLYKAKIIKNNEDILLYIMCYKFGDLPNYTLEVSLSQDLDLIKYNDFLLDYSNTTEIEKQNFSKFVLVNVYNP